MTKVQKEAQMIVDQILAFRNSDGFPLEELIGHDRAKESEKALRRNLLSKVGLAVKVEVDRLLS